MKLTRLVFVMGSNRAKVKSAHHPPTWCESCDGRIVPDGRKCRACGNRQNGKKRRLPFRDSRRIAE